MYICISVIKISLFWECVLSCYPVIVTSQFCPVTLNAHKFTFLLMSLDGSYIRSMGTLLKAIDAQSNCASNVRIYCVIH